MRIRGLLFALALLGCSSGPGPKEPDPQRNFVPGPTIIPHQGLVFWLDLNATNRVVRLPIIVRFKRHQIVEAFVGVDENHISADAIEVQLDDAGMGISLVDRLRMRCPKRVLACTVWLDGRWHGGRTPPFKFSVMNLDSVVEPEDRAQVWIETGR